MRYRREGRFRWRVEADGPDGTIIVICYTEWGARRTLRYYERLFAGMNWRSLAEHDRETQ